MNDPVLKCDKISPCSDHWQLCLYLDTCCKLNLKSIIPLCLSSLFLFSFSWAKQLLSLYCICLFSFLPFLPPFLTHWPKTNWRKVVKFGILIWVSQIISISAILMVSKCKTFGLVFFSLPAVILADIVNTSLTKVCIYQPGLIKICTSVHFLCDTVLCTLLHVSPQFQREMSTEWQLKQQVKYVNPGTFLLCWYRYVLLCFYYVASGTYCGCSEFKYLGSVPKS